MQLGLTQVRASPKQCKDAAYGQLAWLIENTREEKVQNIGRARQYRTDIEITGLKKTSLSVKGFIQHDSAKT